MNRARLSPPGLVTLVRRGAHPARSSRGARTVAVVVAVLGLTSMAQGVAAQPSYDTFRSLLERVDQALNAPTPQLAQALALLSEARRLLDQFVQRPPPSVDEEKRLRRDLAKGNLERWRQIQDARFADMAVQGWIEYVGWYESLDSADSREEEIQSVVLELGKAIVSRGNEPPYDIQQLFSEYSGLQPEFHNRRTLDVWRYQLFRCPTWPDAPDQSFDALGEKLARREPACREHWEDFRDFLHFWLDTSHLAEHQRRRYRRWYEDLSKALGRSVEPT